MKKLLALLIGAASLLVTPAYADFTGKNAATTTVTFKNPNDCTSVVCTPIYAQYDSTGTNAVAVLTAGADGASNTANGALGYSRNLIFNGATWDRWLGDLTNGAFVNVKTSVLPTGAATAAGIATVNTTLGSPFQAGGSIGNTTFAATQATSSNLKAQVDPLTAASWGIGTSTQNSASVTNGQLALGQFNTTPTTITTGNMSPFQMDSAGNLLVNIKAGAAAGGTSSNFSAAFPSAGTAVGMTQGGNMVAMSGTSGNLNVQCANCSGSGVSTVDEAAFTAASSLFAGGGGFFQTTATNNALTNGQQGMWQMTANRAGFVNLRDAAGAEIAAATSTLQTTANTKLDTIITNTGAAIPAGTNVIGHVIADTGSTTAVTALPAIPTGSNVIGHVVADTGSTTAVTALPATPAGTNLIGKMGIDQTTPGTTNAVTQTDGTNTALVDPCQSGAKVYTPINVATATNVIIAGVTAKKKYVCGMFLYPAGTDNIAIYQATTGTSCVTAQVGVIGGVTTSTGINATAQAGFILPTTGYAHAATTVNATDLCITTSASVQLSGVVVTVDR